jgi:hypothetical protein
MQKHNGVTANSQDAGKGTERITKGAHLKTISAFN